MTLSSVQPKVSQQSSPVHGVWQLLTYLVEVKESGETFPPMGDKPTGYVIFTPEGRLSFTLSAEGRQPATTDQERAALLNSVFAYTGSYGWRATAGSPRWMWPGIPVGRRTNALLGLRRIAHPPLGG